MLSSTDGGKTSANLSAKYPVKIDEQHMFPTEEALVETSRSNLKGGASTDSTLSRQYYQLNNPSNGILLKKFRKNLASLSNLQSSSERTREK